MSTWKIACVQMDVRFADKEHNLKIIHKHTQEAASADAKLVIFPECALTGYAFDSKEEAMPVAETVPGPCTESFTDLCKQLDVWLIVGSLECVAQSNDLYNVAILIGPSGIKNVYRKIHLPHLGVDRFTTPGNKPFAVADIDGLRVGMNICYDGSFPESARCLTLLGADLVVLPTNWPMGAKNTADFLIRGRALENNIFYAACNRVGEEKGWRFYGRSQIVDVNGNLLAVADNENEQILYAEIDPGKARNKHICNVPGKYELHRTAQRRPEMYGALVSPVKDEFKPSRG